MGCQTLDRYLADGYELGKTPAENRLGCVSGAGKSGIMGEVVRSAFDAGGSNVPRIIELEGLPEGMSSFWLRGDIYTVNGRPLSGAFQEIPGTPPTVGLS